MTKKELKELADEDLIKEFAFALIRISQSYKIHKCDIKRYDNATEEMINRNNMITTEIAEEIKHIATL